MTKKRQVNYLDYENNAIKLHNFLGDFCIFDQKPPPQSNIPDFLCTFFFCFFVNFVSILSLILFAYFYSVLATSSWNQITGSASKAVGKTKRGLQTN